MTFIILQDSYMEPTLVGSSHMTVRVSRDCLSLPTKFNLFLLVIYVRYKTM